MINQLKEIRKNTGLTQQEFAKELDVALSTVASVENGTREISKSVMKVLIEKYKVSANWLLTGEGEMFTTPDTEVATKEQITNIPIIKNKIEKSQKTRVFKC